MKIEDLISRFKDLRQTEVAKPDAFLQAVEEYLTKSTTGDDSYAGTAVEQARSFYRNFELPEFTKLSSQEREYLLASIHADIVGGNLGRSGKKRHNNWVEGWAENFVQFKLASDDTWDAIYRSLTPKYFSKYPEERIDGQHIRLISKSQNSVELIMLAWLVDFLVTWLSQAANAQEIWEFGCGTGHHLFRLSRYFDHKKMVGLDWAESSQQILEEISRRTQKNQFLGLNFDYFSPNYEFVPNKPTLFFSVASLEQIGGNHGPFIDYCLAVKPSIVVNIEPVAELLGTSPEEEQSKDYFLSRNYLQGFYDSLLRRESEGKLEVIASARTGLGSKYIEGYSVVIWRPTF